MFNNVNEVEDSCYDDSDFDSLSGFWPEVSRFEDDHPDIEDSCFDDADYVLIDDD